MVARKQAYSSFQFSLEKYLNFIYIHRDTDYKAQGSDLRWEKYYLIVQKLW